MVIGYTAGVYDLFHVGHLNVIKNAKQLCDKLIVAVSTDELVQQYKNKTPVIPFAERKAIVEAVRYVDEVVPQTSTEVSGKVEAALEHHIDVMFVGDDWKGTAKWNEIEAELNKIGVRLVYLPHTDGISSTMLREKLKKENEKIALR